jgi:hypothetical protein
LVDLVDTPVGREMLKTYLGSEPYPHFEAHPSQAGLLVRIEEGGERTVGRFVNRTFVPVVDVDALDANAGLGKGGHANAPSAPRIQAKVRSSRA